MACIDGGGVDNFVAFTMKFYNIHLVLISSLTTLLSNIADGKKYNNF